MDRVGRLHAVEIIWGVISIVWCGWEKDWDQKEEPEQSGVASLPSHPRLPVKKPTEEKSFSHCRALSPTLARQLQRAVKL